jgi:MFS family permease
MTTDARSAQKAEKGSRNSTPWLILAILLIFSIAAPLNQFKVPPIIPILMSALGISISGAGLLMSVYAITGLILALPAGIIFQKTGHRVTGILAGGSIILGAVLGALSQSMGGLLASRVIEGAGTSFMAVLAPAIIARWFIVRKRGTAMGIWSTWVPVGTAMTLLIAPTLAESYGWRAVWWFGAGYALVATILYLVFVKAAPASAAMAHGPAPTAHADSGVTSGQVMRNRNIWLLAAAFAALNAAVIGLGTYMPTFLVSQHGMALGTAALVASITTLITIFSAPGGGILSDKIGSRKKPYLVGFAAAIILLPLTGVLNVTGLIILMVVNGLVIGVIPTNIFSAAVEATGDERQGGAAMAVIMVGQNAGMLLGLIVFGTLVQTVGWPAAFASLGLMAALGLLAGWLAKVR